MRIFRRRAWASHLSLSSFLRWNIFFCLRRPCFYVHWFYFSGHPGHPEQHSSVRTGISMLRNGSTVFSTVFKPHFALLRLADNDHLLFSKLVDTVYTSLFDYRVPPFSFWNVEWSWSASSAALLPEWFNVDEFYRSWDVRWFRSDLRPAFDFCIIRIHLGKTQLAPVATLLRIINGTQ